MTDLITDLPVQFRPTHLEFNRSLTWAELEQTMRSLTAITIGVAWWYGDLLSYASKAYPETWTQLIPEGFRMETLRNWMWVAERYPRDIRDLPRKHGGTVPWSIYQAAASLPDSERYALVHRAGEEGLTTGEVRQVVREPKVSVEHITCPACGCRFEKQRSKYD